MVAVNAGCAMLHSFGNILDGHDTQKWVDMQGANERVNSIMSLVRLMRKFQYTSFSCIHYSLCFHLFYILPTWYFASIPAKYSG